LVITILKCCVDFYKNLEIGLSSFEAKMQKVIKETRNRKKGSQPTGPISAQPAHRTRRLARWIVRTARPAAAQPARTRPSFFLYLFPFFRTYLYSNTYISSYTTSFSDPFISTRSYLKTLAPQLIYPSIYSQHLHTSKFLSPKSQNPLSQNFDFNL
jgi:hypothetical protein